MMHGWGSIAEALRHGFEAAMLAVELAKDDPVALSLGRLLYCLFWRPAR